MEHENAVSILGIPMRPYSRSSVHQKLESWLRGSAQHHVVTATSEMAVEAQTSRAFRERLQHANLVIADTVGMTWACRRRGIAVERFRGGDLIRELAELCSHYGKNMYLLGGRGDTAQRAAHALAATVPGLEVKGYPLDHIAASPPSRDVIEDIQRVQPSVLLVAYGVPRQEAWIAESLALFPSVRIAVGIGGVLDVLAGNRFRAPNLIKHTGTEWLWRLIQEPRRLPRILRATLLFPAMVLREDPRTSQWMALSSRLTKKTARL